MPSVRHTLAIWKESPSGEMRKDSMEGEREEGGRERREREGKGSEWVGGVERALISNRFLHILNDLHVL